MVVRLAPLVLYYLSTAYGAQVPKGGEPIRLAVDADGAVLREESRPRRSDFVKAESSKAAKLNSPTVASHVRFASSSEVNPGRDLSKVLKKAKHLGRHPGEKKLADTRQPTLVGKAPLAGAPIHNVPTAQEDPQGRFHWGLAMGAVAIVVFAVTFVFVRVNSAVPNENEEFKDPETLLGGSGTFLAACVLGMVNNNAYNTIMGASQQLAAIYDREDLITLFPGIMLGACLVLTILNGVCLVVIPFRTRIVTLLAVLCISYVILAISTRTGGDIYFALSLLAAMGIGASTSLGELCCLSFLRRFPPEALGGWGAGTGLAGIFGSALYLSLESIGFTTSAIFIFMTPTVLIYWWAFQYLENKVEHAQDVSTLLPEEPGQPLTYGNFKSVCSVSYGILFCMVAVYFLEYFIYPGLVDRDTLCPNGKSWLTKNAFTMSWIAYNVGVTCSRASVTFFRIERLWILVVLQFINACLWIYEATTHQLIVRFGENGYYIVILWMIWVGVMGGCTYVNCMHAFGKRQDIPNDLRELGITIGFAMSNIGIVVATGLGAILDTTLLSFSHLFPDGCPQ